MLGHDPRTAWGGAARPAAFPAPANRLVPLLLLLGGLAACGGRSPASDRPPSIVFVLIDTLRADHLSCYGYERETSPHIDRIAGEGVRFEHAFSVCNWTNPTIASLFTGRFPQAVMPPAKHAQAIRQALPEGVPTLAEVLGDGGYRTVALVDHPGITPRLGFARGFGEYALLFLEGGGGAWSRTDPDHVLESVERALDAGGDRPLYLYLHLVYPHQPYDPPAPYAGMFGPGHDELRWNQRDRIVNDYDAEIRFTDELVGRVFDALGERGRLDDTWLVLTADHGEGFWEHGAFEHGQTFYDEVIRVPLVVRPPGGRAGEPAVVDAAVSNIDLFPTLTAIAGIDSPPGVDGTGLGRFLRGGSAPASAPLFSESSHSHDLYARAVIDDPLKLVNRPSRNVGRELFDWRDDPAEESDLAGARADELERLRRALGEHVRAVEADRARLERSEIEPDEETLERLHALGYVDD